MWSKIIILLRLTTFIMAVIDSNLDQFENDENFENQNVLGNNDCVCVPLWQCSESFFGYNENGYDLMDARRAFGSCKGEFDVCCKIQCGRRGGSRNKDIQLKYDQNKTTEFSEFPWMLEILDETDKYRCGASLIHPQVALTAAHCVEKSKLWHKLRAGEWNRMSKNEPLNHQDRLIKRVIIHPFYDSGSLRNDIAMIIVGTAFELKENVGLICLPKSKTDEIYNYNHCLVTGWGKSSYKDRSYRSILKKVNLSVVQRAECQRSLQNALLGPKFILHSSFICAGGETDTCKGDGGSPLICPVQGDEGRYVQIGIVSWGLTCGAYKTPGVYVNVLLFREWIDEQMFFNNININVYKY